MAILSCVRGLTVEIFANDQALPEYEDHTAQVAPKSCERFIEAQSRAVFEIRYKFEAPFPEDRAVSMIVTIDGKDVDEPLIHPDDLYDEIHVSEGPLSNVGASCNVQRYSFAPIRIEEDNGEQVSEELKKRLEATGIITCEFFFLTNPRRNRHQHVAHNQTEELGRVGETAVKGDALSHQAILGEIEPTEVVEYFDAEYDDAGEPFATFHFYYRSLAALQDLHILPRPADANNPIEILDDDDANISQLTREQLEAEVRRLHDLRKRMKRERSESVTVVGEMGDIGDSDCVAVGWKNLRKKRRTMRTPQFPKEGSDVVVLVD